MIPYEAIVIGISFLLSVLAIIKAETSKVRSFIIGVVIFIFCLRILWPSPTGWIIWILSWAVFGIACFIYIKLRDSAIL